MSLLRFVAIAFVVPLVLGAQQKYRSPDGHLRVALVKQSFLPDGQSKGPATMAEGGIQAILSKMGATVRVDSVALTSDENTEYGGGKRRGVARAPSSAAPRGEGTAGAASRVSSSCWRGRRW